MAALVGRIPDPRQRFSVWRAADLFTSLSDNIQETFGLVVIEAMACGTPVISTRRGAVPEIIEHGRTGVLVDQYREMEDPAILEQADRLDPSELRREVEQHFSPEHMVANHVAAYEATIEAVGG